MMGQPPPKSPIEVMDAANRDSCAYCGGACSGGCCDPLVLAGRARAHAADDMREALRVFDEAETALKVAASGFNTARKHFDAVKRGVHPEPRRSE